MIAAISNWIWFPLALIAFVGAAVYAVSVMEERGRLSREQMRRDLQNWPWHDPDAGIPTKDVT